MVWEEPHTARWAAALTGTGFCCSTKHAPGGCMSRIYRTRLSEGLAAQLVAFCHVATLPASAVLREALRYFLQHPAARDATVVDPRTEA